MPKVSVIVPIFNVAQYIERCARSLFEQTLDDIEYVLVDDCSQDDSFAVLERIMQNYPDRKGNVHILHNENNVGPAISRKNGFDIVTGEYVICCDSDDWVERDMYEKLYNKAVEGNYDVCICDYRMVGDEYSGDRVQSYYDDEDYLTSLLRCRITGSVWNKLVRRELYDNPEFIWPTEAFCEDYACSMQVAMSKPKVGYVPEALYNYYKHAGSIVAGRTKELILKKQEQNLANYKIVEKALLRRDLLKENKSAFTVYKLGVKNHIRPWIKDKYILHQWRNTFVGLGKEIWHSKFITVRVKIVYILTYLGLFPYFGRDVIE